MQSTDRLEPNEEPKAKAEGARAPRARKEPAAPRDAQEAKEAPAKEERAPRGQQKAAPQDGKSEAEPKNAQQPRGRRDGQAPVGRGRPATPKAAAADEPAEDLRGYKPRLREKYLKDVVPQLKKDLGLDNVMEVPRVTKVVLNMGLGEALTNPKALETAERDMATVTGQKPVITKAKKSVANFKLREGQAIGVMVTLRGIRMYEFLDRLMNIALPRVRDFRGTPNNGFDGRGNYSLGIREHIIFPEIDFNSIDRIRGMQVTIVTTARTDVQSKRLLELLGMAFAKDTVAA